MKSFATILFLCLLGIVFLVPDVSAQTISQSFEIGKISKKFVHIPVKTGAPKTWITVNIGGVKQHEFEVELAPENPDFLRPLKLDSGWVKN